MASEDREPKTAIDHFNKGAAQYEKYSGGCTRELALRVLDLPELADAGAPGSVVLDNACGTGIITELIMKRQRRPESASELESAPATIHLADPASNMVELARQKLDALNQQHEGGQPSFTITTHVLPGEDLTPLPSETFTHSITNLGILFFADGLAGAKEIHRTLRSDGVAAITTWTDLGYIESVIKPAQQAVRPDQPPYQPPVAAEWFEVAHLESVLARAGFRSVEVRVATAHYGAATLGEVVELLETSFSGVCKDWSEEEKERFREVMREKVAGAVEEYVMPGGEKGVGILMKAAVAVCRK
jgi:ubiquinone/menaquinone biosynthesis C-methylase UbiE